MLSRRTNKYKEMPLGLILSEGKIPISSFLSERMGNAVDRITSGGGGAMNSGIRNCELPSWRKDERLEVLSIGSY